MRETRELYITHSTEERSLLLARLQQMQRRWEKGREERDRLLNQIYLLKEQAKDRDVRDAEAEEARREEVIETSRHRTQEERTDTCDSSALLMEQHARESRLHYTTCIQQAENARAGAEDALRRAHAQYTDAEKSWLRERQDLEAELAVTRRSLREATLTQAAEREENQKCLSSAAEAKTRMEEQLLAARSLNHATSIAHDALVEQHHTLEQTHQRLIAELGKKERQLQLAAQRIQQAGEDATTIHVLTERAEMLQQLIEDLTCRKDGEINTLSNALRQQQEVYRRAAHEQQLKVENLCWKLTKEQHNEKLRGSRHHHASLPLQREDVERETAPADAAASKLKQKKKHKMRHTEEDGEEGNASGARVAAPPPPDALALLRQSASTLATVSSSIRKNKEYDSIFY